MKLSAHAELKRARVLLGTFVEIRLDADLYEGGPGSFDIGFEAGFEAMARVQALMSFHDRESDLSRLNRAEVGAWIQVDPMTAAVLEAARELEEISGSIFNAAAQSGCARAFEVEGSRARRMKDALLDLGGIAKGFAVDLAVNTVQKIRPGVSGVINAGGDLRVFGSKSQIVQLRAETSRGPVLRQVSCSDLSLATSWVRRNRPEPDDKDRQFSASHWLRGQRFLSGCTVSVLAKECIWADALTKVVLMGDQETARACLAHFGAEALIFDAEGRPLEAA